MVFFDKELKKYKLPKISKFNKKYLSDVDIIFTALPNGEAQLISKFLNKNNVLIDLAADFRLTKSSEYKNAREGPSDSSDNSFHSAISHDEVPNSTLPPPPPSPPPPAPPCDFFGICRACIPHFHCVNENKSFSVEGNCVEMPLICKTYCLNIGHKLITFR